MLKVWGRINSINVQKVVLCLEEIARPYERIDAGLAFGVVNTPAYKALNPNATVPTIDDDGTVVWESNVIVRYLAARYSAGALWPTDPAARAVVDQWTDWQQTSLGAVNTCFRGLVRVPGSLTADALEAARRDAEKALAILDADLQRHTFVGSDTFSMADCVIAPVIHRWMGLPLQREVRPGIERYAAALATRPSTAKALPAIQT